MDRDLKLLLGRILGETYRTQKRVAKELCPVTDDEIFGLVNGLEWVVDQHVTELSLVTKAHHKAMVEVLNRYFTDEEKLKNLKGFYDIENELASMGVDRSIAYRLVQYFRLTRQFKEVLDKFDSVNSPTEMRNPQPWDHEI